MDTEQHWGLWEEIRKLRSWIRSLYLLVPSFFCPALWPFLTAARNFTNVYMRKDPIIHVLKALASIFQAKSARVSSVGGSEARPWRAEVSLLAISKVRLKPLPFLCVLLHLNEAQLPLQVTFKCTDALTWVLSSTICVFIAHYLVLQCKLHSCGLLQSSTLLMIFTCGKWKQIG